MKRLFWAALITFGAATPAAMACTQPVSVCATAKQGSFALIRKNLPAAVLIENDTNSAVRIASEFFADDLERVSGTRPARIHSPDEARGLLVVAGVLGQSKIIDGLVAAGKLDVTGLAGQWEGFRQAIVEQPFPKVARALVIAGADRRGAAYGLYDLSEKIGVSPWYWFADVPVQKRANLFLAAGSRADAPQVRYRGFFINDEAPAFTTWGMKKFGGYKANLYKHVLELNVRMKGNYLWPAMWAPRAFNDDDRENMVLADAMGVVMGTSHHEPMTRAQNEWQRNKDQGVTGGKWDYQTNGENLRKFWRGGIERMVSKDGGGNFESLVTLGMRGDGDEPMSEGTAISLLESIVADQRKIIAEVTGRPAEATPQVWALYKEVQDYYDKGMKVPDDVTLLFADDNWGQIRRLPADALARKGGYGVYYHFDYVGGPRNYKWLNTNQIEKTWQQMDLAWQRGARALWVVNVGDIKPMEYPLSFFMAQAWNPQAMDLDALARYPEEYARATFGPAQARDIAELLTRFSQLAALRKPELLDAASFPLTPGYAGERLDGGEFGQLMERWRALVRKLEKVKSRVPAVQHDAFFQIVEHPILALANLYEMYYAVAWNHKLFASSDWRTNYFAKRIEAAYRRDTDLMNQYHQIAGGKWDGMMLQTHIGYTTWQQPATQVMPEVKWLPESAPDSIAPGQQVKFGKSSPEEGVSFIEAAAFSKAHHGQGVEWRVIRELGRSVGSVTALPQGRPATAPADGVYLEYAVTVAKAGELIAELQMVPTLNTSGGVDVRIGVSLDEGPVQTLSLRLVPSPDPPKSQEQRNWEQAVIDNLFPLQARFAAVTPGKHVVKVWRLDDNAVIQRLALRQP